MDQPGTTRSRWDWPYIASAAIIAAVGVVLAGGVMQKLFGAAGNPPNMGLCVNCFLRDMAGSLGLHKADVAWYFRPEIPGIIIGAYLASLAMREHKPKGGQNGLMRFFFGAFMGIGAMIFLGCTTRMALRLGGGDLNALVGFGAFAVGVFAGTLFLKKEFTLGEQKEFPAVTGTVLPLVALTFLVLFFVLGDKIFKFSAKGPGSMRADMYVSAGLGVLVGAVAYWGRFCFMKPFRDLFLMKSGRALGGVLAFVVVASVLNLAFGTYKFGFKDQPLAHSAFVCNCLGMFTVGLAAVLLDGCPIRQLVKAGSGDMDSGVTVMGLIAALSLSDNFGITCSPAAQPTSAGFTASFGIAVMAGVALFGSAAWKSIYGYVRSK